jgi:hypothetical protein
MLQHGKRVNLENGFRLDGWELSENGIAMRAGGAVLREKGWTSTWHYFLSKTRDPHLKPGI